MNKSHTPGPWEARTFMVKGGDRMRDTICHVGSSTSLPPSRSNESIANARLIAAAPDMLAALRLAEGRLALLLRQYPGQSETCDHPTATRYVLDKVTAAITKATEPTT